MLLRAAGSLALLLATGCGGVGEVESGSGTQVRYVQVAPDVPEADFFVNGVGTAYGLGFESFTSYLPLVAGPAAMAAHHAGRAHAFLTTEVTLAAGRRYTVILSEAAGVTQQHLLLDEETVPPAGQMALRIVNEVQGAAGLTFHVAEPGRLDPSASGSGIQVGQGAAGAYLYVPAASPVLVAAVVPGTGLSLPLASVTVKAGAGAVRTLVFAGTVHKQGSSRVVAFAMPDADPPS